MSDAIGGRIEGNRQNAAVQDRIDQLDDEAQNLLDEYREVVGEIEALETYIDQVEDLIADQEEELAGFAARRDTIADTERRILPLMQEMTDHLERFIEADSPFLVKERLGRVQKIRETLGKADVSTSEKFRLLMEAYQIEADYGRSFEAYRGPLNGADDEKVVEFLRIGRVALVYRTLDGSDAGMWSDAERAWVDLPRRFSRNLEAAFRVAREQAAPQLLILPAPAAEKGPADAMRVSTSDTGDGS